MSIERQLPVADEIEKELDQAFPYGDDVARSERLRQSILKSAFEGRLGGSLT
jgi:hypothetical protein